MCPQLDSYQIHYYFSHMACFSIALRGEQARATTSKKNRAID